MPLDQFEDQLERLGLADEAEAKTLLDALRSTKIPSHLVEAVERLLLVALRKQRQRFRKPLEDALKAM